MCAPPVHSLVLVVDDEPAIRTILCALLTDEGYRVATAADGQEALDSLTREVPAVIVSDIKMPRVDGLTMVHRLRERGVGVPVVLISANYAAVDVPGVRFLAKPFDLDTVMAVVARCLAG